MKSCLACACALFVLSCNPAKKAERTFGEDLFQHWIHSFEDDGPGFRAFRPAGYAFPPARGREGFEIQKGGGFVHHAIAPTDGNVAVSGAWKMKGKNTLTVKLEEGEEMEMQIMEVKRDMLKVGSGQ